MSAAPKKLKSSFRQIDLSHEAMSVRDFLRGLSPVLEPIELLLHGTVIAKLTPPPKPTEERKRRAREDLRQLIEKARANSKGMPAKEIQRIVDKAVREVRVREGQRRY